jgi:hypothetical protein
MPIVMAAASYDVALESMSQDISDWFWATAFGRRYAVGSNTVAVNDFRRLSGAGQPARELVIDREELREATKQANGALHRAFLCSLSASLSLPAGRRPDFYSIFRRDSLSSIDPPLHLRTMGFVTDHYDSPRSKIAELQFMPDSFDVESAMDPSEAAFESLFEERLNGLLSFLRERVSLGISVRTKLSDEDASLGMSGTEDD